MAPAFCVAGWGEDGECTGRSLSLHPVLCPQEPDQVYEGITFDDFLKVGTWGWGWARGLCWGLEGTPAGQEMGVSVERGQAWVWPLK